MAYARHQSFYLRDKWISKGLKAVHFQPRFFFEENSPENVGLGKNMVMSLRFWLLATGLINEEKVDRRTEHHSTDLGNIIFKDRLLQRNDTVSILHYQLVRNEDDLATVFEWFFNEYKETVTDRDSLLKAFIVWVNKNDKPVSKKSLKRDIDCLVQLYTKEPNEDDPEDFTFSPFTKLNIMKENATENGQEVVHKIQPDIEDIGLISLYYILLKYSEENETSLISLDEIVQDKYLWGNLFNLSRNRIIDVLNLLANHKKFPLEYVRTNNLDNVRLPQIKPIEFLSYEYEVEIERGTG
ncbi:DUF4007 family protein [Saliterribacillus persicus]|uniref:Uncharacterized protein DUF4007 n=1 Tax=Saliterribacillus persicus TaxID=930114 RepID=A0A368X5V1_9BACI|nr:DUF4007 family protein [Saliterribacillus persicus]RCW63392.1 uncharacterized protein DUF4007 [Saliterribacillus persicus]